jgi:hypothetical protein
MVPLPVLPAFATAVAAPAAILPTITPISSSPSLGVCVKAAAEFCCSKEYSSLTNHFRTAVYSFGLVTVRLDITIVSG